MAIIPRNQGAKALATMDLRKSFEFVRYVKAVVKEEFQKIKMLHIFLCQIDFGKWQLVV